MIELGKLAEMTEIKKPDAEGFREIKPESGMSIEEARSFWDSELPAMNDHVDSYYNSYEDRLKHTPSENSELGKWEGQRGESKFIPNDASDAGQAAKEKLSEKGLDGISYENAEPNFSEFAEATVEIEHMTENRFDFYDADGNLQRGNFSQADMKCAEQWNASGKDGKTDWTARDVYDWRHDNNCSWHERCDTKTMDLVPREIHGFFSHSGGVSECKARDAISIGGGFDE